MILSILDFTELAQKGITSITLSEDKYQELVDSFTPRLRSVKKNELEKIKKYISCVETDYGRVTINKEK
jgi:hypothetical protein